MLIEAGQAIMNYLSSVGGSLVSGIQITLTTAGTSAADFFMKLIGQ